MIAIKLNNDVIKARTLKRLRLLDAHTGWYFQTSKYNVELMVPTNSHYLRQRIAESLTSKLCQRRVLYTYAIKNRIQWNTYNSVLSSFNIVPSILCDC